jgi:hypothetical protein
MRSLALVVVVAVVLANSNVSANPVFARKYNTSCFTCHVSPPLLNEFGRRFQANGYIMPGMTENASQASSLIFPLGMTAQPKAMHTTVHDNIANRDTNDATTFAGLVVILFSSASLGSHFSYYIGSPITVASGETSIEIETAYLMYRDVLGDASGSVNFRAGKFLLFAPFTPMFLLSGQDPLAYTGVDALDGRAAANMMDIGMSVFGVSAYGTNDNIGQGLRWELAYVAGNNSDVDLKSAHAFYAALDQTWYLDNAPLRVGGFFFGGTEAVSNSFASSGESMPGMGGGTSELGGTWQNELSRLGLDLEISDPWLKRFTLFGLYMKGTDHNVDSLESKFEMSGGFVGLNAILLPEALYAYARYDFVTSGQLNNKQRAIDLGIRYQPLPNVVVSGGFTTTLERTFAEGEKLTSSFSTNSFTTGILFGF